MSGRVPILTVRGVEGKALTEAECEHMCQQFWFRLADQPTGSPLAAAFRGSTPADCRWGEARYPWPGAGLHRHWFPVAGV